jgi:hypothetical protein
MNPTAVRLFLTLLWLFAGIGLLAHDLSTGQTIWLPLGRWRVPFWAPCLLFGAFDFIRWWFVRRRPVTKTILPALRPRERKTESQPNPELRLDDPPSDKS